MNQNLQVILDQDWSSSREGHTLAELRRRGHVFVVSENLKLPFRDGGAEMVVTNGVPVDMSAYLGVGISSSEIRRVLASTGSWLHDGVRQ